MDAAANHLKSSATDWSAGTISLRSELRQRDQGLLLWLIPLSGIVTVTVIWLVIVGAIKAMRT